MQHKNLVWDIEGNGLLPELSEIWMLVAYDIDTSTEFIFTDHDKKYASLDSGLDLLYNTKNAIGHNLFGYDYPALKKIKGFELRDEDKVTDTWILSLLNCYKRTHKHGLAGWGEHLGYSKGDFKDFEEYSDKMLQYCRRDVKLNAKVYEQLHSEATALINRNPLYAKRIELEMYVARLNMKLQHGWVYDRKLADDTLKELNKKMNKVEREVEPHLGVKRIFKDKAPKTPKFTKKGNYDATTARLLTEFLGIKVRPEDAHNDIPPIRAGEYFQRYTDEPITMGQMDDVKKWLMDEKGWKPNEWNRTKTVSGWKNSSPKLEGKNLDGLGELGKSIKEYYMLRHRRSFLEGYNKMADSRGDGRISGNMWTIGTPTFRVRHEGLVNMPSADADTPYGIQIRSTLTVEDDRCVVGCDSAGNQLRGACHVMNNQEYTDVVLNQDMHQYNADMVGCTRKMAKVFIYRILFGSTAWGLGKEFEIPEIEAQKMIDNFMEAVPEFAEVVERLEKEWNQNNGYIFGEMGNILFVDDVRKCLNAYLQDLEKATCTAAMYYIENKFKELDIDYYPLIFYHDEGAFAVKKEQAEIAAPIMKEGFREGPKMCGVMIMDGGEPVIGRTYADVH